MPFIEELDYKYLRVVEEYEVKRGDFGMLNVRGEEIDRYTRHCEIGTVKEFNQILEYGLKVVDEQKTLMKNTIIEGMLKYPNNESIRRWMSTT
ncbi:hypothetical protein L2E82_51784 [Cichorium intybus]|nr:hypothetical protein L2E82_51784 [Cichorium intybus]